MTDKLNEELAIGDLVLFTPDTVIDHPGLLIIFHSLETRTIRCGSEDNIETIETNSLKYYPLTKEGLEVARYDTNTAQTTEFYRIKKFTISNVESCNLLKMDPATLRGENKSYYDSIQTLIV